MADAIGKAVRAQGAHPVKPHQVKAMILAARRAYAVQAKLGLVGDETGFDAWRRATLHDVVGAQAPSSFRAVTQRDYARVVAYFLQLAGERPKRLAGPAADTLADERRRALFALALVEGEVAGAFGGRDGARKYTDALFANIHKTDRLSADARQIWAVIFTIRNRAAKKRSKTASGARGSESVPLSPPTRSVRFPAFSRGS